MEEFRRSKRAIAEDSYFNNTNRKVDILNLKVRMVKDKTPELRWILQNVKVKSQATGSSRPEHPGSIFRNYFPNIANRIRSLFIGCILQLTYTYLICTRKIWWFEGERRLISADSSFNLIMTFQVLFCIHTEKCSITGGPVTPDALKMLIIKESPPVPPAAFCQYPSNRPRSYDIVNIERICDFEFSLIEMDWGSALSKESNSRTHEILYKCFNIHCTLPNLAIHALHASC